MSGHPRTVAALATLATALLTAPGASAAPSFFSAASTTGDPVFVTTTDQLVPSDTDNRSDIYKRSGTSTTLFSANLPLGGNGPFNAAFAGASGDGARAFFETSERLVSADIDGSSDIYQRSGGVTTLVSTGPSGGNGAFDADPASVSDDGQRVLFTTSEKLTPGDTDGAADVYLRFGGTTTLLSVGSSGGNGVADAQFRAASTDAGLVFFVTSERLVPGDTDGALDVYESSAGATVRISTSPTAGNGSADVSFGAASADGSVVIFETNEAMVPGDTDSSEDVYQRTAGQTTEISTSATAGNGAFDASLAGASADGSHAFLFTSEQLSPNDSDSSGDIYDHTGSSTSLVSTGPTGGGGSFVPQLSGSSADGSRVFFATDESLVAADDDSLADVYQRASSSTSLVSVDSSGDNGPAAAFFTGASDDGARVFFATSASLSSNDTDSSSDVYQRSAGTTTLLSTGPIGGNASLDASMTGVTSDGTHVFFETREHLTADDTDSSTDSDVFERTGSTTTLISGGGVPSTSPDPPTLSATNPASPSQSNDLRVLGGAPAASTVGIYATADCSGAPLATGSGSALSSSGIPVTVPNNSTTVFRATVTDDSNNTSSCSLDFLVYRQFTSASVPVLTATVPGSPSNNATPLVRGSAAAGDTVRIYADSDCTGAAAATGTAAALASPGIGVSVPANMTSHLSANATNSFGTTSACSTALTYTEDSIAPKPPSLDGPNPSSPANANSLVIVGSAEALSDVRLYLNESCQGSPAALGRAAQLASPGFALVVADDSVTEVHATATDRAGNRSRCSPEPVLYVEDSTPPRTGITFGPAFKTRDRTPTFRFKDRTGDRTATFFCRLDRRKFRPCGSPKTYRGIRRGRHTLRVKGSDGAGNRESKPALRRFRLVRRH